ncbi:putative F-box protein At3g23970 [Papaver somniferum]|uniref:putative F-box protein At3g23970 n=1 Tax=Papaver somniferum TaxID=3469 RepID=UPI000E6FD0FD|nr:putative F-box protein At3g23970 [Papaver somniferum]
MAYPDLHSGFMSRNQHLFSFKFLKNHKPFQGPRLLLLGSCNGLVLCISRIGEEHSRYHVCNPLTQTWVSLPLPPGSQIKLFDVCGIFFDYSLSSFASCYKVVRIPQFKEPSKNFNVEIYSSDLGIWESFQVSCDENVVWRFPAFDKLVILNGALFWIQGGSRMLVYNLNQINKSDGHQCSLINLPDMEFDDTEFLHFSSHIGESEGWLCYAKARKAASEITVSVWVLNMGNWEMLHKDISVGGICEEVLSRKGKAAGIQVLGFSPVDRNIVLLGCKKWVWGFNIKTRSFEEFCLDNRHVHDASMMFLPFVLKPMPTVPFWTK